MSAWSELDEAAREYVMSLLRNAERWQQEWIGRAPFDDFSKANVPKLQRAIAALEADAKDGIPKPDPRCHRCGCFSTQHDGRGCKDCECARFEEP